MLEPGNKLLVAHRRMFEKEDARYFVGEVVAYDQGIVKIAGFSFVRDAMSGNFIRKNDPRTKIVSLVSGAYIFYQLPEATDILQVRLASHDMELELTDGLTLHMNLTEQVHRGEI
ncbi:MAG: hypothetical protein KDA45_02980 [Planctomycetales bacterium]|nr:hypothetical protein [Planctomycetales bacterium]